MKLALPVWRGRVSPVFDVAGQLMIVELTDERQVEQHLVPLEAADLDQRVQRLLDLEVEKIVCGAISRPLESLLAGNGIEVISGICGDAEEVLQAFFENRLQEACFAMPGCCRRGMGRRQGQGRGQGKGQGQGRGQGKGQGRGQGRGPGRGFGRGRNC